MGGAVSAGESNDELIDNLVAADYIKSSSIERVFRAVDRAHYLLPEFKDNAYKDLAWKSGNLHLSAPCIYSEVMESLNLCAGLSFLNLGSGTGYLSTLAGLILGPTGINHGVEIHQDVIEYANTKLDEFFGKSSALDEYEFCKPSFVLGNCLNLSTGERLYDRVYCGAACPENCETYMKQLLNIGGILVMPLNDQLLRIVRISETGWAAKSVLPVSFASLVVTPEDSNPKEQITLPPNEPQSLQDSCRSLIRRTLRRNIELEHPHLTAVRRHKIKKRARRTDIRLLHNLIVPIYDDSDSDQDSTFQEVRQTRFFYTIRSEESSAGESTAIIGLGSTVAARLLVDPNIIYRVDASQDSDEEESVLAPSSPPPVPDEPVPQSSNDDAMNEQRAKIPKREKFDSGLGDEMENGKGLSSTDSETYSGMDVDYESETDAIAPHSVQNAYDDSASQMDNESESSHIENESESSRNESAVSTDSDTAETWKPLALSTDGDDGDDELEKECDRPCESSTESSAFSSSSRKQEFDQLARKNAYSHYMKLKIQELPLPLSLKKFINMYRDF